MIDNCFPPFVLVVFNGTVQVAVRPWIELSMATVGLGCGSTTRISPSVLGEGEVATIPPCAEYESSVDGILCDLDFDVIFIDFWRLEYSGFSVEELIWKVSFS